MHRQVKSVLLLTKSEWKFQQSDLQKKTGQTGSCLQPDKQKKVVASQTIEKDGHN